METAFDVCWILENRLQQYKVMLIHHQVKLLQIELALLSQIAYLVLFILG